VAVHFRILFRVISAAEENAASQSEESPDFEGMVNDIRAGGVCFVAKEKIRCGDVLELRINLHDKGSEIRCISRVLRAEPLPETQTGGKIPLNKIAALFLAINRNDRQRIDRYCQQDVTS
jgi:hypothetical protein